MSVYKLKFWILIRIITRVQAKILNFNPYIYTLYYQSNTLSYRTAEFTDYPWKMKISFVTGMFEQPVDDSSV